ncbi:PQQ-binding-like beta-propeller repeat protein [Bacillus alkalicellulosilyticus]|uniref:PQQ-binding-like beta-propeller repeat protein n=1 Tax=Alkalihalobacterium alkalicellulosilyticum TaxID=1912214 RepID=UPI00148297F4|nr:PQQ-binding-like beta-propeller repeat protein [Bacillus alkalicellulosilyticus]
MKRNFIIILFILMLTITACSANSGNQMKDESAEVEEVPTERIEEEQEVVEEVEEVVLKQLSVESIYETGDAIYSSPLIIDQVLYVGSNDGILYAIDLKTNEAVWQFDTEKEIRSEIVGEDTLFVAAEGVLYGIDRLSGKLVWSHDPGYDEEQVSRNDEWDYRDASPLLHEGLVYYATDAGDILALNQETGELIWEYHSPKEAAIRTTPIIKGGVVYFADYRGDIHAVDIQSKELVWTYAGSSPQTASMLLEGDTLIVGGRNTDVIGIDIENGKEIWYYTDEVGSWFTGEPVLTDGLLYIGGSDARRVYVIDPSDGEVVQSYPSNYNIFAEPLIKDETIYFFDMNVRANPLEGGIHGYHLEGDKVAEEAIGKGVVANGVLSDNVIYVGGIDGNIYKIEGIE